MALSKKNSLLGKKDFDRVFKEGKTVKGSFLFIKFLKSRESLAKFGFTVSSKVFPKAVDRNRLRRVLSETIRQGYLNKISGDVVIVVNKTSEEKSLINELKILLDKLN